MLTPSFFKKTTHVYYLTVPKVKSLKCVSRPYNQSVSKAAFLPEALGENQLPGLFQLLEATCTPWLMAPSSILKVSSVASFFLKFILLFIYFYGCIGSSFLCEGFL